MPEHAVLWRVKNAAVDTGSGCIHGYDKTAPASRLSPVFVLSVDDDLALVKVTMSSDLYIRPVFRPDISMPCRLRFILKNWQPVLLVITFLQLSLDTPGAVHLHSVEMHIGIGHRLTHCLCSDIPLTI